MARGRLISKSLGSSRKFHAVLAAGGRLGEFCQVLFPLLIANTDDFGRMAGDAFTVKNVVLPSSKRPEAAFEQALEALASVDLIDRYVVDGVIYLQVKHFDEHQANLHKRTKSLIPESPGISGKYRPNITKSNLTESKGTEEEGALRTPAAVSRKIPEVSTPPVTSASKRPIYTSDRFAVHEWQLVELGRILGSHVEDFDLHAFFDGLSQQSRASGLVIPKDRVWDWLQAQVLAEAQRRGLPILAADAHGPPTNKRIAGLVTGGQKFLNRRQP